MEIICIEFKALVSMQTCSAANTRIQKEELVLKVICLGPKVELNFSYSS